MALFPQTLDGLRNRIITETVRNDLADDLASILDQQIASAVDYYESERWWFNEVRTNSTFTAGGEYQAIAPVGYNTIDALYIVIGGVRYWLTPRSMEDLENLYTVPQVGQPTDYAVFGTNVRLWPTPNIAYQAIWLTINAVTPTLDYTKPLGSNTSANMWTQGGQDLITSRVKMNLYRDQFRDSDGLLLATAAEKAAYATLKGTSNVLLSTGKIRSHW